MIARKYMGRDDYPFDGNLEVEVISFDTVEGVPPLQQSAGITARATGLDDDLQAAATDAGYDVLVLDWDRQGIRS